MKIEMRGKRAYGAMAAVAVVVLIAWQVWRSHRPVEVQVLDAATNVSVTVAAIGNLDAEHMSAIGFDMAGSLAEIPVRTGDEVHAGLGAS
jgi:multidrug efflux pump subunit AcrA (membrane-fusion protein)